MAESTFPFIATHQKATTNPTVYHAPPCDPEWKIEWTSACFIDDPMINYGINVLWFNAEMQQIEYVKNRIGKENGNGVIKYTYQRYDRVFTFKVIVDDLLYDALVKAELHTDMKLYNLKTGSITEIESFEIKAEDDDENYDYIATMTFKQKDSSIETNACDCGAYQNAPFEDDCGDQGLEPRGSDDVCAGFDVDITVSGNVLTANDVGGPSNPAVYKWYYNPGTGAYQLLSSTAQTVAMGGYGTYRVIVSKGSCQVQKDHLNQDPCNGLFVSLSKSNTAITATVIGCESPTYMWKYVDQGGTITPLPDTGQTIVAQQTGNYKVIATCGTCSREAIIYVEVTNQQTPQCAGIANTITRSGDSLTANVTGCNQALTINWSKDDGTGSGSVPISTTGPTVPVSGSGNYKAVATCGTCIIEATYLIIECNIPCNIGVSLAKSGDVLTATPNGVSGGYEIKWYKNTGNGYGSSLGTGDTFTISGNAMYKAVITSGECVAEKEIMVLDCTNCTVDVSLAINVDVITATVTGCTGGSTVEWYMNTGNGDVKLASTALVLNTTVAGIYTIKVKCGECEATKSILYTGCSTCTPVNPGIDQTVNVC